MLVKYTKAFKSVTWK